MKTKHFLIFILLLPLFCTAQPYQSIFGQESTVWYVASKYLSQPGVDKLTGTAIGRVIQTVEYEGYTWYEYENFDIGDGGYLRENLQTGEIFWKGGLHPDVPVEKKICDFSLQKGDVFTTPIYDYDIYVDSVYFENGKKIILFNETVGFDSVSHQLKFIEGIGPSTYISNMLFYHGFPGEATLCVYKDGAQVYNSGLLGGRCTFEYNGISGFNVNEITIKPNPATEQIWVYGTPVFPMEYYIANITGQVVCSGVVENEPINIQNLNPGLYFLTGINCKPIKFLKL